VGEGYEYVAEEATTILEERVGVTIYKLTVPLAST
jgi:hypothetical protein